MKLTLAVLPKEELRRIAFIVLGLEALLFLLPTTGKIEGVALGYWQGVELRILSGHYWAIALLGGIGAGAVLAALIALSGYLTKFGNPPSDPSRSDRAGGRDN